MAHARGHLAGPAAPHPSDGNRRPARSPLSPAARLKCRLCSQRLCARGPDAGQPSGPRRQKLTRGEGRPQQAAGLRFQSCKNRVFWLEPWCSMPEDTGPNNLCFPRGCSEHRRLASIVGGSHPGRRSDANTTSINKPLVNSRCPQDMRADLDPSPWVLRKRNTPLQLNPTWDHQSQVLSGRTDPVHTCRGMTSLVTRNSRRWKSEMVSKNTAEVLWDK